MAPVLDLERLRAVHLGPGPAALGRGPRQREERVGRGRRVGGGADGRGGAGDAAAHRLEELLLEREAPLLGGEDLLLERLQRRRGEPLAAHRRLPPLVVGRDEVEVRLRHLDVVAEHLVEADLQRADPGPLALLRLERGDDPLAVLGDGDELVELPGVAAADEPALAQRGGRLEGDRGVERRRERLEPAQPIGGPAQERRRARGEEVGEGREREERAGEGPGVPRVALPEHEAREQPLRVRHGAERRGEVLPRDGRAGELADGVEPGPDAAEVGERVAQPLGEAPPAGRGDGAVEHRQERPLPAAARERPLELEVRARRLVEEEHVVGAQPRDAIHVDRRRALRLGEVGERGGRGGAPERQPRDAEAVEARHPELAAQPLVRALEVRVGPARHRDPHRRGDRVGARRVRRGGEEQLPDPRPPELVHEPRVAGDLAEPQLARGGVEEREPGGPALPERDRPHVARLARLEHLVVEDHARRDDAGHLAPEQAGLPGRLRGLLDLVADRDLEPLLEQLRDVAARRVVGDPAHRDPVVALGAGGERDLEGLRGGEGVLEEHLVEVAEPEEEDRVGDPRLRLEVLPHHRGRGLGDLRHGRRVLPRPSGSRGRAVATPGSGCYSPRTCSSAPSRT